MYLNSIKYTYITVMIKTFENNIFFINMQQWESVYFNVNNCKKKKKSKINVF